MRTVEAKNGNTYKLLNNRIKETGPNARYVTFKDLRENMPKLGRSANVDSGLHNTDGYRADTTWLKLTRAGRLSIGCVDFDLKESAVIFRAAGIRIGHAKKGKGKKKAATKTKR